MGVRPDTLEAQQDQKIKEIIFVRDARFRYNEMTTDIRGVPLIKE